MFYVTDLELFVLSITPCTTQLLMLLLSKTLVEIQICLLISFSRSTTLEYRISKAETTDESRRPRNSSTTTARRFARSHLSSITQICPHPPQRIISPTHPSVHICAVPFKYTDALLSTTPSLNSLYTPTFNEVGKRKITRSNAPAIPCVPENASPSQTPCYNCIQENQIKIIRRHLRL